MLMLPTKESLTVEFKSEQKRPQSHDEIVDNVVALANTEGGTLYLGIEDDGTVTGVCDEHRNINGLAALIFNKTVPQLPARVMAASFHNVGQVHDLLCAGIQAVTLPPDIIRKMMEHPGTEKAVDDFSADWAAAYGRDSLF